MYLWLFYSKPRQNNTIGLIENWFYENIIPFFIGFSRSLFKNRNKYNQFQEITSRLTNKTQFLNKKHCIRNVTRYKEGSNLPIAPFSTHHCWLIGRYRTMNHVPTTSHTYVLYTIHNYALYSLDRVTN